MEKYNYKNEEMACFYAKKMYNFYLLERPNRTERKNYVARIIESKDFNPFDVCQKVKEGRGYLDEYKKGIVDDIARDIRKEVRRREIKISIDSENQLK